MRYPTTQSGLVTIYQNYPKELENKCFACRMEVEDAYVTAGHRFHDADHDTNEIRHLKRCTNKECALFNVPMNPMPSAVLPYKQYSLAVWKWIAEEYKLYNANAEKIHDRIQDKFGLKISVNTIRNYMDEIDVLISNEIDAKTLKLLMLQGIILLALDGQKPEETGKALWLFVDLLSNRVLKVVVLENADSETLHSFVETILSRFHVKLVGLVSDKQNNITKMHDDWYLGIPHQYCHFHFLQNLWNHIEVKDCSLHQRLAKAVKHLYILRVSKQTRMTLKDAESVPIREVFSKIERKLRKILKARNKKFETLRGVTCFAELQDYTAQLENALSQEDEAIPGITLLKKAAKNLRQILTEVHETYTTCKDLQSLFKTIQDWLGKPCPSKGSKLSSGDSLFNSIWKGTSKDQMTERAGLRSFLPHKDTPEGQIKQEFVRLYDSYREGLFAYYDFPMEIRTNSVMEGCFGQEKGKIRQRNSKANVGMQIRLRGKFELKQIYAGKAEVKAIIQRMGPIIDDAGVKEGLKALAQQRAEETELWQILPGNGEIRDILQRLKQSRE